MFRTSNPTLNENVFTQERAASGEPMTIQGAVNKSFILLFLLLMTASFVWSQMAEMLQGGAINPLVGLSIPVGIIGGLIFALVTCFKKSWAPVTAPIYALFEGLVLGGISSFFEYRYPGIVIQAVGLTMGTLFCLLGLYKSGIIKVTDKFKMGLFAATGAIALLYLVNFVMGFFGHSIPFIASSGPMGIVFSFIVVGIAALNLVLDFDFIEHGASSGAPRYMEWYAAFGLMVTLIWLYIEILRLLSKLRDRR